jgi:general L-amino acid transport system substrate-binding protein
VDSATGKARPEVRAGNTLAEVRNRGELVCGVNQGLPGFSNPDDKGHWSGIDVDYCRALASAIFDDPTKVKFRPLNAKDRFTALQSGEIDILSRNTTWTMSRDTQLGLDFAGVSYYDGQGFIVHKDSGIENAADLDGATICTQTGTTTELNVADYFRSHGYKYKVLSYEKNDEALAAYDNHRPRRGQAEDEGSFPAQNSAGDHFKGTIGAGCAAGRSAMGRHRALDALCLDQCRGAGRYLQECGGDEGLGFAESAPLAWR